ncbi:TonB-dependent receptor [Sunxiuqinia sp. sy24]|uniref:TonB-dependent receptor n=1 Tax=Sunxiuqinia sp. sy24 TaxID=3461495 RepID=UPI004046146C
MMEYYLKRLIVFFIASFPAVMLAQSVSGIVISEDEGKVIGEANVVVSPGNYGTATNANGEFKFNTLSNGNYKLTVSMVGFISESVNLQIKENKNTELTIRLQPDNRKIDEVTIRGNYSQTELIENPGRELTSLMPAVSKVTATEIEQQGAVSLIDALKFVPGGWTETRGRKVKQFFSVRGQKYPYPSYSINGIWQNEFHEMPYFFNSSNISEIKIIRSSSALLKGLSALTGVIDVKTKQPRKNEVDLYAKYGSLNTYNTGASYGNSTDKLSYRIGMNGSGTEGPDNRNGKENIYNAHGFFEWKMNDKLSWSSNIFYLDGMRQLTQPIEPAADKFRTRKESYEPLKSFLVSSKLQYRASANFSSELYVNYAHRKPKYHNENLATGKLTEYNEKDWEVTINQINAMALSEQNTLRFGALYNYWIAPEGKRYYYGKKAGVQTVSGVVTDQHNFGRLVIDAGFRLTQEYYAEWGGFSIEGSGGKFSKVEPIVDQWQSPVWQATSGLSYSLPANASLHFSFAGGSVNPRKGALNEMGETPDNETRTNYDLGYVKNFQNSGRFSATAFFVNRKKAIEYSGGTVDIGDNEIMELYRNTDKRNYGFELEIKSLVVAENISLFSNITLMRGEVEDDGDWAKDDEMPDFIANAGINFQKKRMDINGFLNYTGKYKNDRFVEKAYLEEFGKAALGDFIAVDLTAGYRLGENQRIRVFADGKNLLDTKYQTVPGYPDYGRIISLGFQVKL